MKKRPNIAKNYLYNLMYQILAVITPLLTTPYISRVIGENGIGIYSYSFSITSYFAIFAALGINTYGKLQIAGARDSKEKTSALFWEIFLARIATAALSIIIYIVFVMLFDHRYQTMLFILGLNVLSVAIDITWFFQGLEMFSVTVVKDTVIKITSVVCIFIFVKDKSDLYKYAFIIQGSSFLGFAVLWGNVRSQLIRTKIDMRNIIKHWTRCWIYFIPTLANTMYSYVDKTMIGAMINTRENGFYEQASKIQQVAMSVITSVSTVGLPRMAYLFKNKKYEEVKDKFAYCLSFVLMVSIPMVAGIILVADILVPWFLGPSFERSIILLRILSLLILISGLGMTVGQMIVMPSGKQKQYNYSRIGGLIVNIFLNYLLIKRMGAVGAAAASVFSEFVVLVGFSLSSGKYFKIQNVMKNAINYLIAAMVMTIVVLFEKHLSITSTFLQLMVIAISGGIVYCLSLLVLRDKMFVEAIGVIKSKIKGRIG